MTPLETLVIGLWVALFSGCLIIIINNSRNVQPEELHSKQIKIQEKQPEAIPKLNSILNEVENNLEILDIGYDTNKWGHRKYLHRLFRDAFDNAKATENFNSLSAPVQKAVSSYYGEIDRWNELVDEHQV